MRLHLINLIAVFSVLLCMTSPTHSQGTINKDTRGATSPKVSIHGIPWKGYQLDKKVSIFHIHYNLPQLLKPWAVVSSSPFSDQIIEYRFTNPSHPQTSLKVLFSESPARINAHLIINQVTNFIQSPDNKVKTHNPKYGDLYLHGHWVRDNIYLYFKAIPKSPAYDTLLHTMQQTIDSLLVTPPKISSITQATPKVTIHTKSDRTKIHTPLLLNVKVNDSSTLPSDLQYSFFSEAGQVFMQDNNIYYISDTPGSHSITLYVQTQLNSTTVTKIIITTY